MTGSGLIVIVVLSLELVSLLTNLCDRLVTLVVFAGLVVFFVGCLFALSRFDGNVFFFGGVGGGGVGVFPFGVTGGEISLLADGGVAFVVEVRCSFLVMYFGFFGGGVGAFPFGVVSTTAGEISLADGGVAFVVKVRCSFLAM